MATLESRLQKKFHLFVYALVFMSVLLGLSVLLEGCTDNCEVRNQYTYYEPVYTALSEVRAAVEQTSPEPLNQIGKIYFRAGYLFVNEPGKGIHVIDNMNPEMPMIRSFINIPGNYEMAVKGNTLYADSYIDLVLIDISNLDAIREVKRLENVFSAYNSMGFSVDANNGIVTDWVERTDIKIYESDCNANIQPWGGIFYESGIAVPFTASFDKSAALTPGTGSGPGVGGSMARFTINQNHLYTLDAGDIQTIDITADRNPQVKGRTPIAWDMETIFPYKQNLFIGSRTGMHIIDVSNPESPLKLSTYQHVSVCDPVVVTDTLAYVTLRSGSQCEGFTNQLEVINIKNLVDPQIVATYPMTNPHGLGIDESTLFICDGDAGLKIYDAADVHAIDENQLAHYKNVHAFDAIPFNNVLMMIGEDGIFQFDYTDPKNIKLLSELQVTRDDE